MKYPRTKHLPFSPGGTSDDKRLLSYDSFLNTEVVITEKLDGGNSCLSPEGVFARSHASSPSHPSFDKLKQKFYALKHNLKKEEQIFGENCFAVHSIEYKSLTDDFFAFGIRQGDLWLPFDDTLLRVQDLGLSFVPVLFRGTLNEKNFKSTIESLVKQPSAFGGDREGIVIRKVSSFSTDQFETSVAKWVRADHVQTDEHWMNLPLKKQIIQK